MTDTEIKHTFIADAPEDHDKYMSICVDVYKHVQGRYTRLLRMVRDNHYKTMISETYREDLKTR